jgi:hypothetical protein
MMDNEEKIVVQKAVRAMAAAAKEIDKLTAERDALQAQVEALSKLHSDLTNADMVFEDDVHSGYLITTEQIDEMEHLLATPAACLAQVRAEAVIEAVKFFHPARDIDAEALKSYAERIRQGGTK